MKKGILQVAALYLCLFLLCGCAGSASPPEVEALSDENDDGLRLTQTQAVKHEKYLRKDEFANFLSLAQK